MIKPIKSFAEARELMQAGNLQFHDGQQWVTVDENNLLLLGRVLSDYRRRPEPPSVNIVITWETGEPCGIPRTAFFSDGLKAAAFLSGKNIEKDRVKVYLEWPLPFLSITRIEHALDDVLGFIRNQHL